MASMHRTAAVESDYAWYSANAEGALQQGGEKHPNDWGIYDMHGNVWEWVEDWYGDDSADPEQNPSGSESGSPRVVRGGSWGSVAERCRIGAHEAPRRSEAAQATRAEADQPDFFVFWIGRAVSYPFTLCSPAAATTRV